MTVSMDYLTGPMAAQQDSGSQTTGKSDGRGFAEAIKRAKERQEQSELTATLNKSGPKREPMEEFWIERLERDKEFFELMEKNNKKQEQLQEIIKRSKQAQRDMEDGRLPYLGGVSAAELLSIL